MHRGSLAAGDWIQLNGPFNLLNINSVTFRVADTAGGPHRGLAAGGDRGPSGHGSPGRSWQTYNLVSTGGTAVWTSQTFPISLVGHPRVVPRVPRGHRRATGNNLFNLNWAEFVGPG